MKKLVSFLLLACTLFSYSFSLTAVPEKTITDSVLLFSKAKKETVTSPSKPALLASSIETNVVFLSDSRTGPSPLGFKNSTYIQNKAFSLHHALTSTVQFKHYNKTIVPFRAIDIIFPFHTHW